MSQSKVKKRMVAVREASVVKWRRLQESTSTTSTASSSSTSTPPGISGSGGPSTGVSSAPTGPSPGVIDSPVVVPLELDQPGPSGVSSEEVGASEGGATI